MSHIKKTLSWLLVSALFFQISFNSLEKNVVYASAFVQIEEGILEEDFIVEDKILQFQISPQYIMEKMINENGIYEYKLNEKIISQAYVIEATVGVTTRIEIFNQLPKEIENYDIDWLAVIGKFAVGTAIIIAVGIVSHVTQGATYFIFASPEKVLKDALIGGAIGASLSLVLKNIKDGKPIDEATLKYTIEGFADGYMWGAITSVLLVAIKDFKMLKAFKRATGRLAKIKLDGTVLDKAGRIIGRAYYDSKGLWHLVDEVAHTVSIFDSTGKELLSLAANSLPANAILKLGAETATKICHTDDLGRIYRVDDKLLPDITYQFRNNVYRTDAKGRIAQLDFSQLELKSELRPRFSIADSKQVIAREKLITTDHNGHLIADLFNGDNTMANIVRMDAKVNQGKVKAIENSWRKAINEGKKVSGSITISYKGSAFRPSEFIYSYNDGSGSIIKTILNH